MIRTHLSELDTSYIYSKLNIFQYIFKRKGKYLKRGGSNLMFHVAMKCIRYSLPNLINETSSDIIDKVYTHSVTGFRLYVKKCIIQKYSDTCHIVNCYIRNQN